MVRVLRYQCAELGPMLPVTCARRQSSMPVMRGSAPCLRGETSPDLERLNNNLSTEVQRTRVLLPLLMQRALLACGVEPPVVRPPSVGTSDRARSSRPSQAARA
ncbi:hypothetical protein EVAR_80928_1 [Eumeta japonica]|uniref:Uncharacterized protein n=1 Tax=Eumeta variegata TaxID=151549 RepID=A0A4C1V0X1_EUMVA|nr:hypothetical protein EVAR_80928_1 [Eumeta japonica]